jgi:hypothetical protein
LSGYFFRKFRRNIIAKKPVIEELINPAVKR